MRRRAAIRSDEKRRQTARQIDQTAESKARRANAQAPAPETLSRLLEGPGRFAHSFPSSNPTCRAAYTSSCLDSPSWALPGSAQLKAQTETERITSAASTCQRQYSGSSISG
jgi:hypothetical protein